MASLPATVHEGRPCWTPGGAIVAAESSALGRRYVEYAPDGGRRVLGRGGRYNHVTFAPGCAVVAEGRLRIPRARDTGALIRETTGRPLAELPSYWPVEGPYLAWSPDGALIADVDDSGRRDALRVTETATGRLVARKPVPNEWGLIEEGAFSPDGRAIAFHDSSGSGDVDEIDDGITVFDVATQTFRRILRAGGETEIGRLAWSPRGDRIAVVLNQKLHLIDLEGRDLGVVAPDAEVVDLEWSPDGTRLALKHLRRVTGRGFPRSAAYASLSVAPAEPGARKKLLRRNAGHHGMAAWSPDGARLALFDDGG